MEVGINLKVNGVTYGPVVAVSVEMSGNGTVGTQDANNLYTDNLV